MRQTNLIMLKSRRTGASTSTGMSLFRWQIEYLKFTRRDDRKKRIKSIFNI